MSQPVGDLVVKIDGDSAKFDEEVTRLNRQLAGVGKNANTSSEQVTKHLRVKNWQRSVLAYLWGNIVQQ
ncbi:phage tail tape measure protein, lambda family [Klebsiella pneumoniae]|nr:phage tail tape measure protein, lambda family [Klebsiella pneumoniae]